MEFGPILRALSRNKIGAILIALQIAFTMTVVVNAWFMIGERLALIDRPSGILEDDLFYLTSTGFADDFNVKVSIDEDLRRIRQTPGVVDATVVNAIPLSGSGWSMGLRLEPGDDTQSWSVAVYMVDEHGRNTMGTELIAGENFAPTDVEWREPSQTTWPDKVIITQALAEAMFPEDTPAQVIGRTVYIANEEPVTITGIVAQLQAPWSGWNTIEQSMYVPQKTAFSTVIYLIRSAPNRRDQLMPQIEELLATTNDGRLLRNMRSMTETRERSYALDGGLAKLLVAVMCVLVAITAVGVLGLASFSVRRRTKQIGTRRALGASQRDILRYFLVENACITGMGVALGAVLTVALNVWLVGSMGFPKIHWIAVPVGMLALLAVGQIAVLGPARRACRVSPAVATRTV